MINSLPTLPEFRFAMIGKKVLNFDQDIDSLNIQLEGGWSIVVWGKFFIRNCDKGAMAGRVFLTTFVGDGETERLLFDDGSEITVDLGANAKSNRESMAVYGPNNMIVVWE